MKYIDSVYGGIVLPDYCKTILDLPPLTRLRNVKQLGFTPSVYTGAVHTRFEHTVGKTWILINLLEQFQVTEKRLIKCNVYASLLSEIGVYPFSHSTRWLFAEKLGMTKKIYAELLFNTYISKTLPLDDDSRQFVLDKSHNNHHLLKERIPSLEIFPDLNFLRLAGDIDYALRDSHYSGRYSNSFDLRYFRTLTDLTSISSKDSLVESIRELYRSIYSLNSVYGDRIRRFITLIFVRLVDFLLEKCYLNVDKYKDPAAFVDLDDDKFMAIMNDASRAAIKDGYIWIKSMVDVFEQLNSVEIEQMELNTELGSKSLSEIEEFIAQKHGIDKNQVIAINDNRENALGYVLFGRRFKCYNEAIESEYFKTMTGLAMGSNRTNLMNEKSIFYTVIK